jgi:hypothetical protein
MRPVMSHPLPVAMDSLLMVLKMLMVLMVMYVGPYIPWASRQSYYGLLLTHKRGEATGVEARAGSSAGFQSYRCSLEVLSVP